MKVLLTLMLVSGAASAGDADMLRCRELPDGPVRLACYNAIPVGTPAIAATPAAASAPAQAPAATPKWAAVPQPSAPAATKPAPEAEIVSHIAGIFDGWVKGQSIRLANGQVWQVVDDTSDTLDLRDPKVKVERGVLGAIFLNIDGANYSPKVRRVK